MKKRFLKTTLAISLSVAMIVPNIVIAAELGDIDSEQTNVTVEAGDHADSNSGHIDEVEAAIPDDNPENPPATPAGDVDVNNASGVIDLNSGNVDTNNGLIVENAGTVGSNAGLAVINVETGAETTNLGIDTNNGEVATNTGTIDTNNGAIRTSSGIVGDNTGTIDENTGSVNTNTENGTVTANKSNGHINTNEGTVTTNAGSINANSNTGSVDTNSGYIGVNNNTVSTNTGNISSNYGTVDTNNASGPNSIVNNYGDINENNGIIEYNGITFVDGTGAPISEKRGSISVNNGIVAVNEANISENRNGATVDTNYGDIAINAGTITENFGTVDGTGSITNNYGNANAGENTVGQQWWEVWANTVRDAASKVNDFLSATFGGADHTQKTVTANNRSVEVEYVKDSGSLTVTPSAGNAILGFTITDGNGNVIELDTAGLNASYNHSDRVWTVSGIDKNVNLNYTSAEIKPAGEATLFYDRGFKNSAGDTLKPGQFISAGTIMDANFNDHLGIGMRIEDPANPGTFLFMPDMITQYAVLNEDNNGYEADYRVYLPSSTDKKYRYSGSDGSFAWFELVDIAAEEDPDFIPITPQSPSSSSTPSVTAQQEKDRKNDEEKTADIAQSIWTAATGTPMLSVEMPALVPSAPSIYADVLAPTITNPAVSYAAVDLSGNPINVAVTNFTGDDSEYVKAMIEDHTDYIKQALEIGGMTVTSVKSAYTGIINSTAVNSVMTLKVKTGSGANVFVVFVDPVTGKRTYVKPKINKNGTISFEVPFANCEFSVVEAR